MQTRREEAGKKAPAAKGGKGGVWSGACVRAARRCARRDEEGRLLFACVCVCVLDLRNGRVCVCVCVCRAHTLPLPHCSCPTLPPQVQSSVCLWCAGYRRGVAEYFNVCDDVPEVAHLRAE